MKSKKRHQTSSDDSEDSEASLSSSESESDNSSASEPRHKKKRKRADSSASESESDDQRRSKKRKHKKKKKKHGKKKRQSVSAAESISAEEISLSDGELSSKNKRKHKRKHSKRDRTISLSEEEDHVDHRRLHSVVKERERRPSSEENGQPTRTYYQREREYRNSGSDVDYDREREVQRFYRGSSKERRQQYPEEYPCEKERIDKYASYQDKSVKSKYSHSAYYSNSHDDHSRTQKPYIECIRHTKYEERRPPPEEYHRPRVDYHAREEPRAFNRYNQYENRGVPRRPYEENREFRDRRGPPNPDRFQQREYPDRRERYQESYSSERPREQRRDRSAPTRPEKPPVPPPQHRERERPDKSGSEERYRSRPERREDRDGRDDRRERRRSPDKETRVPRAEPVDMPRDRKTRFDAEDNKEYNWGKTEVKKEGADPNDKEKPNFGLSGKLTADVNTVNGVVIKYTEPDDAKQPKRRWRFYPFKGDKALPILYIHRQSAFLIGRDKKVVDISLEHPSISKQHAALQYRATPFTRPDGTQGRRVRPYIIDLESANGTFVNNKKVEPRRYNELLERDVVKFGFSQREYVLLHENSKDDAQDDDNQHEDGLGANVTLTEQVKQEKRVKQEVAEDGE